MTDNPAVTDAVNNLRYVIGNAEAHNISQHTATDIHIVLAELSRRPPAMTASSDELKAAVERCKLLDWGDTLRKSDADDLSILLTDHARLLAEMAELKASNDELMAALFMCAAHCQGGHSEAGMAASKALGVPFPIRIEELIVKAEELHLDIAFLWPWSPTALRAVITAAKGGLT